MSLIMNYVYTKVKLAKTEAAYAKINPRITPKPPELIDIIDKTL